MRWFVLLLGVFGMACGGKDAPAETGDKLKVVATTGMVADIVRNVGGDRVVVEALMGAGVDPHLYRATAGDMRRLRAANVVFYTGHGLEGRMADVLKSLAARKKTVAVAEAIPNEELLHPEDAHGHADPHIWFDVSLWARTITPVAAALTELDAAGADTFAANAARYRATLAALHERTKKAIADIPHERRVLITSHDAFRYYGRAYGIEVRGLQGISTVSDAGVKDMEQLAAFVRTRGIKALFVETSVSPKAIQAVQRAVRQKGGEGAIGGELFSDAMGDHPPEDTYIGMVEHNTRAIVGALK